jgi:hypothetical protein
VLIQMTEKKDKKRSGDIGDKNVAVELSQMSLTERARLAALIEVDGDEALRTHLLGAIGRRETARGARGAGRVVPDRWTQIHVLDRLEEAYTVLAGMPMVTRPKQYGNAMPTPFQQKLSILDQIEMMGTGELEQLHEDRNRVRLAATSAQVSRMDQALGWPFEYLRDRPELAKAISLRAMWAVMRADIRKQCQRRGLHHETFNWQWQEGLSIITATLVATKVPVT